MDTRVSAFLTAVVAAVVLAGCSSGQPAETAPAAEGESTGIPRTAEGHPDFTGVWNPNGVENITDTLAPGSEIVHTAYGAERFKTVDQANDPNAKCLPWGPTRMLCCTRMPIGFIFHKDVIAILTESQQTYRLVYMDGRKVPEDLFDEQGNVDPQVGGWMGFSTGRWDGDKLIVDTVGPDSRTWIDGHGAHEHSDKMKLTEVFEMADPNTINLTVTIDDPVFYQKPWSFVKKIERVPPGDRLLSHACAENEKDLQYMEPGHLVGGGRN